MKRIVFILFAVTALFMLQSCDTTFMDNADTPTVLPDGDSGRSIAESEKAKSVNYCLVEGSTLFATYSPAGAVYAVPIKGSFTLTPVIGISNMKKYFSVDGLSFESKDHNPRFAGKGGNGHYELGTPGTVVPGQRMDLSLSIAGSRLIPLDSGSVALPRDISFPWIDITLKMAWETTTIANIFPSYELRIVAVPMKNLAFTTTGSLTSGISGNRINHGDLLTPEGKVLLSNSDLIRKFNLWPTFVAQEPGLDAVTMPRGLSAESARPLVYFSTDKDILADDEPGHGDILSSSGRVMIRNRELVRMFGAMPIAPNAGLDALALYTRSEETERPVFIFSFKQGFFSETLGVYLSAGDLLLSTGRVFMTEKKILRNYHPLDTRMQSIHTDAVALKSNNEVWFSVDRDFYDAELGRIGHGDILSDNGRIVFRNRDLVAEFDPLEDLGDFGLDGLTILE